MKVQPNGGVVLKLRQRRYVINTGYLGLQTKKSEGSQSPATSPSLYSKQQHSLMSSDRRARLRLELRGLT